MTSARRRASPRAVSTTSYHPSKHLCSLPSRRSGRGLTRRSWHQPSLEQLWRFFDLTLERQQAQKQATGSMRGCPAGNLTLELSTEDDLIRSRVEQFFQRWLQYFEDMLRAAQQQGAVPATLDVAVTAQALLAYFEGVMLLAKGRNDPSLLLTLRSGALALMQSQTRD